MPAQSLLLHDLPKELIINIAGFLRPESALRLAACSKQLRAALLHDSFWRQLLLSHGFGLPASRPETTFRDYLLNILLHCRVCHLCRFEWDHKTYNSTDKSAVDGIIKIYSRSAPYPAAAFFEGMHRQAGLNTSLRSVYSVLHYHSSLRIKPMLPLREHPIYEGALLTERPLFKVNWTIKRRYISRDGNGKKVYPSAEETLDSKDLYVEKLEGGVIENPRGITVDDMLCALKSKAKDTALLAGPTMLQYCELRHPAHLVLVLGNYQRVYM